MLDFAVRLNTPTLDSVEMVTWSSSSCFDQFFSNWLNAAKFVSGTALQNSGSTVPHPWDSKSGQHDAVNGAFKRCFGPCRVAINGNFNLGDFSPPGPSKAGNFVKAMFW